MIKNKEFYIKEIIDSILIIESYVKDIDFEVFSENLQIFDACCMRLQHIGECGVKLSELAKDEYKKIPFDKMRGFRNRITHDYAGIDDLIVWNTIKNNLPSLKKVLKQIK